MRSFMDVTGIDLVKFVQKVYELSKPKGLGFLHFIERPLSEEDARKHISTNPSAKVALDMDYVNGRACKMCVWRAEEGGVTKLSIHDVWFGHTNAEFDELLSSFGIKTPVHDRQHNACCECADCVSQR